MVVVVAATTAAAAAAAVSLVSWRDPLFLLRLMIFPCGGTTATCGCSTLVVPGERDIDRSFCREKYK
jgi:hypothetical protein